MTEGNEIAGFLGALNTGYTCNPQDVALLCRSVSDNFQSCCLHLNPTFCDADAACVGLVSHINHMGLSLSVEVGQLRHDSERGEGRYIYVGLTLVVDHTFMKQFDSRWRAFGTHLCVSMLVAALAACLVFGLWYPYPYRDVSGGRELFVLVAGVDVIVGPLITLIIFNKGKKPHRELLRDMVCIAVLQMAALAYGLWTVALARPVHLVFEYNRFTVVHAAQLSKEALSLVPQDLVATPWTGPTAVGLRPFRSQKEQMDATMDALQGAPLAVRTDLWQSYNSSREAVRAAAKPLAGLKQRTPQDSLLIDAWLADSRHTLDGLTYVPLAGRKTFWTVVLDAQTADILGYLPIDSF